MASIATLTKSKPALATLLTAVTLALVASVLWVQMGQSMTLSMDGKETQIRSSADTVREVLAGQDIELTDHDVVAPSLDSEVRDGTRIAVKFGRPLTINLDGEKSQHWITATDVASALDEIGLRQTGARISASRGAAIDRNGMSLTVATPKKLTLVVAGRKPVRRTVAAITAVQALKLSRVSVDKNDIVRPGRGALVRNGDRIVFDRVRVFTKAVKDETLAYRTVTEQDSSMYEGDEKVVRAGVSGNRDAVYKVRTVNGHVVATRLVRASDVSAAVPALVRVGTKEKAPAANYASGGTVWDSLAACEAGGNWSINTGNGYYGGLQFSLSTWQSYGGSGLPSENSREQQIAVAERARAATGGYGSWPHCAASLGLL